MPSTKKDYPILQPSPSAVKAFFLAARPRTWIASISPVCIGAKLASAIGTLDGRVFALTLLFALLIQIGTNFANDAFDFLKGADTEERMGPPRAVQQGWISPKVMLWATSVVLGLAGAVAIPLMLRAGFWSISIVIVCGALSLLYTAGPKPLGYLGLGEVLVLVFFGPVAGCGTYFLQTGSFTAEVFFLSLPPGLLSSALLVANNLRDEKTDRAAGKMTLIARWGKTFGACEYTFITTAAFVFWVPWGWLFIPCALWIAKKTFLFVHPKELIGTLKQTGLLLWAYTLAFCFGWSGV